jgi:hypothetical protein
MITTRENNKSNYIKEERKSWQSWQVNLQLSKIKKRSKK